MLCDLVSFRCVVVVSTVWTLTVVLCGVWLLYLPCWGCTMDVVVVVICEMVVCVGVRGWTEEGGASTPS